MLTLYIIIINIRSHSTEPLVTAYISEYHNKISSLIFVLRLLHVSRLLTIKTFSFNSKPRLYNSYKYQPPRRNSFSVLRVSFIPIKFLSNCSSDTAHHICPFPLFALQRHVSLGVTCAVAYATVTRPCYGPADACVYLDNENA